MTVAAQATVPAWTRGLPASRVLTLRLNVALAGAQGER